jgi:5'(3')-deoxyribonucleotidase
MEQLLVDMDGVLADVYAHFLYLEFRETSIKPRLEELYGRTEAEAFAHYEQNVHSKDFFRKAPVMPGSIDGLKYLNNRYKVLVVSAAMEFPDSLIEKHDWLLEYFPFISWKQIVFCGDKAAVKGDIMIDDHPKNLNFFPGRKILFTQPHNILLPNDSWERVDTWKQLLEIL